MAARHRARDVEREEQPLVGRLNVRKRGVEGGVEGINHLADRVPGVLATRAVAGLVGAKRCQQRDRMHAGPTDALAVV
jgi:hypothetical protein